MNLIKEQKTVGLITLLSGLVAFFCIIATLVSVNFNNDVLSDPLLILTSGGINTVAARWSMILDMFGYYLLLLPVIYLFHDWMKVKTVWCNLITFSGVAYILIGSIGASILAIVWPKLITAFHLANAADQQIIKANFSLINDMVYSGMWNLLEMTFAAVWWIFTGYQLVKNKFRSIGWLTIVTGLSCLADAKSGILQISWLHEVSLNVYLWLAIIWAVVIGIFMLKKGLK